MQRATLQNSLGIPQLTREQMGPEIRERIRCARLWCQRYMKLLCNPHLTSRAKFNLYKIFVRPILTYGCELWSLSEYQCKKILRFESGILVAIYKSKYPPRHPKRLRPDLSAVYRRYRERDVVNYVNCERLSWTELLEHEERALRDERCSQAVHWWDRRNLKSTPRNVSNKITSRTKRELRQLLEPYNETNPSTSYTIPNLRRSSMDDSPG